MKKYIFFIISCFWASFCLAQETEVADTTLSNNTRQIFSGFSFSLDVGKLAIGQIANFEDKLAFSGHLLFFGSLQISGEYGRGTINPNDAFENVAYEVDGNYNRFGLDYVKTIKTNNVLAIGFRYGSANFSDRGTIFIPSNSNLSSDFQDTFGRPNQEANWWEFIVSSETKFYKKQLKEDSNLLQKFASNIFIGINYRLRFNLKYEVQEDLIDIYTIPGYGRTFDRSTPAINLFIKYRIGPI